MSLRAELRRHQRQDMKAVKQADKLVEVARRMGVEYDELALWKSREYAIMEREIRNKVASEFCKVADGIRDDYNEKLEVQRTEYNRLLQLNVAATRKELIEEYDKLFLEKLYEAENMTCLINILLTCRTINKAFGYKKAIQKFMDRWEASRQELEDIGPRAMLEKVNSYGLDFNLDTLDVDEFVQKCVKEDIEGIMKYIDEEAGGKGGKTKADIQPERADGHPDA